MRKVNLRELMKNILVTGSDGQLGNSIKKVSNGFDNYNLYYTNKNQLDVSNCFLN